MMLYQKGRRTQYTSNNVIVSILLCFTLCSTICIDETHGFIISSYSNNIQKRRNDSNALLHLNNNLNESYLNKSTCRTKHTKRNYHPNHHYDPIAFHQVPVYKGRKHKVMRLYNANGKNDNNSNDKVQLFYNDDAFGLIFLSSSLVLHDYLFATIFVLVSATIATSVNNGKIKFQPIIPGIVAMTSVLISVIAPSIIPAIDTLVSDTVASLLGGVGGVDMAAQNNGDDFDEFMFMNVQFKVIICLVSFSWSIFQQIQERE